MTRTEFANSNLRNKAIADLYNQAGVTSVRNFDSGEEILTGNSLPNFALPGFDGTMPAHYYFDGDLDKNPVEATTVYGLDNWKKVVTKHPQTGEPMPFSAFVNKKTGEMFVYYKALTGSMFRHEYAHQKIMEYVANNPVTGENSLNRLQIDFANLTNLVYATGDPKAISAFEGYVNHIVYRSLLHGWSDEDLQRVGLYNLGGKQLMDRLTSSSSLASFNDTVFHEFVANVNGLIADPNFKNQLLDSFDRAERAFFYNDTTNGDMESGHVLMKARRFMTDTTSRQTAIDRFIDSFHDKIKMPVDFGELSKFKNQNY